MADRTSNILVREVDLLRRVYRAAQEKLPFETIAICVMPDHLHAIWTLPDGDWDFPKRWNAIKRDFSRHLPASPRRSPSKIAKREKGIWQRRYWEHAIRDDDDLVRHIDYIHYNPVKHGLVTRVKDWEYSSFHRYVANGELPADWSGDADETVGKFGE